MSLRFEAQKWNSVYSPGPDPPVPVRKYLGRYANLSTSSDLRLHFTFHARLRECCATWLWSGEASSLNDEQSWRIGYFHPILFPPRAREQLPNLLCGLVVSGVSGRVVSFSSCVVFLSCF